ncbi:unnamed protein product [Linum tenue]|uniref:FAD-binding PCMH-type domain-containing protein n=2 Tax=Linum tenue TaxID=586396 RepID=A0AAV0QK16_9ROSI|nr:unnamed protein product [Linum tenue]
MSNLLLIIPLLLLLSTSAPPSLGLAHQSTSISAFRQCLQNHNHSDAVLYLPTNSSFLPVLNAYIHNKRFIGPATAKPLAIVTPTHESHVQATVLCAKANNLQIRTRSGGHDYEGLSYRSPSPFILLDLNNLRRIELDVETETAWVEAGATLGELYYAIANKTNTLAFPAGVCPSIGVGGHFAGGGYGNLLRKYGLSVDNVLDARVVDARGEILNRSTMGDLFWAIRGGGGASFGVILSWKVKLVRVPEVVTAFQVDRWLDQGASDIFYRWQQVSTNLSKDIFIRAMPQVVTTPENKTKVMISFVGEYLGRTKDLVSYLSRSFPELGFREVDGKEMSWVETVLFWAMIPVNKPLEVLLNRKSEPSYFKSKSDYVTEIIPREALPGIWDALLKVGPCFTQWNPYGGRMAEIDTDEAAYAHRAGYLFKVQYYVWWVEDGEEAEARHVGALDALHEAVTPYVTKEPREAYLNYRDLENGVNSVEKPEWSKAKVYGEKYFKGHFERLAKIKAEFDPENFFRDQQSIPPFPHSH